MTRSERRSRWVFALLTTALLPFCGGRASDSGSSESHFLVPCDSTCADGLSCVCGVCTAPCETEGACADYGTGAACLPPSCDDPVAPAGQCDVACQSPADCSALGSGYACEAGRCRADVGGGGGCEDATRAVREFVQANQACSGDTDCIPVDTPCFAEGSCAAVAPLSVDHDAAALDALLSDLGRCSGDCTSCTIGLPPPTCVNSACRFGGAPELTCDERSAEASQIVQGAVESADRSCATSADCAAISNSSDCFYGCGAIVSVPGAEAIQATIDQLNAGLCATFSQDGCTAFVPPCPFPGQPECVAGECLPTMRPFGAPCSDACGNQCYVPGTGGPGICSGQCTADTDCEPAGLCQSAGGTGQWCFRRCASDAECQAVNDDQANPLYCAQRTDPESPSGFRPLTGPGEGFCVQSSEP